MRRPAVPAFVRAVLGAAELGGAWAQVARLELLGWRARFPSLEDAAAALDVSPRTVRRLFHAHGLTWSGSALPPTRPTTADDPALDAHPVYAWCSCDACASARARKVA